MGQPGESGWRFLESFYPQAREDLLHRGDELGQADPPPRRDVMDPLHEVRCLQRMQHGASTVARVDEVLALAPQQYWDPRAGQPKSRRFRRRQCLLAGS